MYLLIKYFDGQETTVIAGKKRGNYFSNLALNAFMVAKAIVWLTILNSYSAVKFVQV